MSIPSKEVAARSTTPYRVVSDTKSNNLRRDLYKLDKQQTLVLKGLDREQKAFKRSLDSLQNVRSRSGPAHGAAVGTGGGGYLSVRGGNQTAGGGASPLLSGSRHLAPNGMIHDPSSPHHQHRSAGAYGSQVASPGMSRRSPAARSKSRIIGTSASPSVPHRNYASNSFQSPLLDSEHPPRLQKASGMAKSWTPGGAWKKPTHTQNPLVITGGAEAEDRAGSSGDIRATVHQPSELYSTRSGGRLEQQRHKLPPLITHPPAEARADGGGHGGRTTGQELHRGSVDMHVTSEPRHSSRNLRGGGGNGGGDHAMLLASAARVLSSAANQSPEAARRSAPRLTGDPPANQLLATDQVRLVRSHCLFDDLTTSLPRITTSRPATALVSANTPVPPIAGGKASVAAATATAVETDLTAVDDDLLCNGFEDGIMGVNAQGGKSLAKLMGELENCRYIRHYTSNEGPRNTQDQEDAARRIFAE